MSAGAWDDDPILEPGAALDRLAAWKDRIDRLALDTRAMSDQVGQLRVTVTDESAMVEVTVDAQGALVDLRLGRRVQQLEPERVAAAIMTTVQEARLRIAGRVREIVAETIGTQSPAARAIATQVGERLTADDNTGERRPAS